MVISLIAVLIVAVLMFACWRIARRLYRLIFPQDASVTAFFLALAITLLLWAGPIRTTFSALYDLLRQILIFPFLYDAEVAQRDYHEQGSIFHALNKLLPNANNLLADLDRIPFFQLFFALIVFVLFVRILSALCQGAGQQWIQQLQKVNSDLWLNALVLTIFFLGIYLSVASLCTIPLLQVNQPFTEAERSQIKTQIDAYTPTEEAFNKQFPEDLQNTGDQLADLRGLYAAAAGTKINASCMAESTPAPQASTGPAPVVPAPVSAAPQARSSEAAGNQFDDEATTLRKDTERLSEVKMVLQIYGRERCDKLAAYRAMHASVLKSEKTEADKVKDQVNSNFGLRLTGRERANYTYGLEANYQDFVSAMHAALGRCKSAAEADEPMYSGYSQYIEYSLRTAIANPKATVYSFPFSSYSKTSNEDSTACEIEPITLRGRSAAPTPQLGIFSFLFGWLEESDSLELAVICGMLGVGLVGCIVSSFLRQQAKKPDADAVAGAWIPNIFPVIVLSFTAAIVVYLAIEGGLNVFSSESNQANPYVLLFSCLIGAVFSQDVWDAAHARLLAANIKKQQSLKTGTPPSNEPPAPGAATDGTAEHPSPPAP
ncbi:MAG: hypothetical protein ABSF70_04515 [Terracidiphilus sp.]